MPFAMSVMVTCWAEAMSYEIWASMHRDMCHEAAFLRIAQQCWRPIEWVVEARAGCADMSLLLPDGCFATSENLL